jgi:RHS repeat-associated protein
MFDAHGEEVWAAEIDTYGQLRDVRGARRACPFRFPGQYEDAETGLYYNRFRYYDPEVGGYVSQDPIGLRGGLEPFAYVADPTRAMDPVGLSSCAPTGSRVADAIQSGRPIVIVGRRMSRVQQVADALRAHSANVRTYNPRAFRSTPGAISDLDLEANRSWLAYWARKRNALIVDIGDDPRTIGDISPFYELEKSSLYKNWTGVDVLGHDPGF